MDNLGDEREDLSDEAAVDTPKDSENSVIPVPTQEDDEVTEIKQGRGGVMMTNFQEKFLEIIDNEELEVENVLDLNEIFLS